jgi:hypothetical protein
MKNKILIFALLFMTLFILTGCSVIADIFRAGMGVGIFLVVLVIALVIWVIYKIRRRD